MRIIEDIKNEWVLPIGLPCPKKFTPLNEFDHNKMMKIFREELIETDQAIENNDVKEQIDGMGDMLYVLYNWAIQLGISDCFEAKILNRKYGRFTAYECIVIIDKLLDYDVNDEAKVRSVFSQINDVINWMSHLLINITKDHNNPQIVLFEALSEIHRSNTTKQDKATKQYILNENKKVIKGSNYEPPRIDLIMEKYGIAA